MSDPVVEQWKSTSHEATFGYGRRLGESLRPRDIVILSGTLGAGKTVLSQGIAAGMGIDQPVTSSTFVLATPYLGTRGPLWHLDAYRIEDISEVDDLGIDELVDNGACVVIEWGERIETALPYVSIRVEIELTGEFDRSITITRYPIPSA
ncbi:MAG TPA: tRNA (adenosine(37)-N6)-threonylcarbamoyltransferase complex ATPase subunit type 1 TsaE [Pirellulaceae bacterium]|nr:tRNA (adenosine(37)-N6)-threonylcarbamoyltransferase complex ATPase subunit type 1 TsaE [Pirellulaceae bacterium]